ncbi:MAG: hypothetical protein U0T81_16130 [Saprospiraceae bacterium]
MNGQSHTGNSVRVCFCGINTGVYAITMTVYDNVQMCSESISISLSPSSCGVQQLNGKNSKYSSQISFNPINDNYYLNIGQEIIDEGIIDISVLDQTGTVLNRMKNLNTISFPLLLNNINTINASILIVQLTTHKNIYCNKLCLIR